MSLPLSDEEWIDRGLAAMEPVPPPHWRQRLMRGTQAQMMARVPNYLHLRVRMPRRYGYSVAQFAAEHSTTRAGLIARWMIEGMVRDMGLDRDEVEEAFGEMGTRADS